MVKPLVTTLTPNPNPGSMMSSDGGEQRSPFARLYTDWFRQIYDNLGRRIGVPSYMFENMPTNANDGWQIYVSNGRKSGEGAGVGTGVMAYWTNNNWRRFSDDAAVTS